MVKDPIKCWETINLKSRKESSFVVYNETVHHSNIQEIKKDVQIKSEFGSTIKTVCCCVLIAKIDSAHTMVVMFNKDGTWYSRFGRCSLLTMQNRRNLIRISDITSNHGNGLVVHPLDANYILSCFEFAVACLK